MAPRIFSCELALADPGRAIECDRIFLGRIAKYFGHLCQQFVPADKDAVAARRDVARETMQFYGRPGRHRRCARVRRLAGRLCGDELGNSERLFVIRFSREYAGIGGPNFFGIVFVTNGE
jgi:hypothetical protein